MATNTCNDCYYRETAVATSWHVTKFYSLAFNSIDAEDTISLLCRKSFWRREEIGGSIDLITTIEMELSSLSHEIYAHFHT
jgi:hypothetical protein